MQIKLKDNAYSLYWKGINRRIGSRGVFTKSEDEFGEMIKKIQGQWIEVETDYLWDNQFNTVPIEGVSKSGLRFLDFKSDFDLSLIEGIIGDERLRRERCPNCRTYESLKKPTKKESGKCWACGE